MNTNEPARRRSTAIRWIGLALAAVCLVFLIQQVPMDRWLEAMRGRIESLGVWGPAVFGLIYVAATVLLLPGAILTVAAGGLFGSIVGTATVSIASVTGAALAFLIARHVARERVARQLASYPKFDAIDRAIGQQGWKIVGLLRLSPAIPFNVSNYLYGLTAIRFWPYVLTSWIAMLPGTFLYVYGGHVAFAGVEAAVGAGPGAGTSALEWTVRIVGLLATVAVTVYVTRIARRAIAERTEIEAS